MTCRYVKRATQLGAMALGLAAATVAITGCKVDQQKEVSLYRKILGPPTTAPVPASQPTAPLSLQQAMDSANETNEPLGIRGESYVQSLIDKDRAFAGFLPTIALVPSYYWQQAPLSAGKAGTGVTATGSQTNTSYRYDAPVTGQINLFNGFRDAQAVLRSNALIAQQQGLLLDLQSTVLLNVAQTYYQVLQAEQSTDVLVNSLQLQEERVRDIQARREAGIARPLDVYQTEAQAASTRVQLINSRNSVRTARTILSYLTGTNLEVRPLADQFQVPAQVPSLPELLKIAETNRQDLQAAIATTDAASRNVKIAYGEYLPTVSLNMSYFLHRESSPSDSEWNGLISVNVPIFSAGRIRADVRDAWSLLRQATLSESLLRRQIRQDVSNALDDLLTSRRRLSELDVQLRAAEESFRQAETSYNVGLATNLERLTAQNTLLSSQLQLSQEQYNYKVLYLDLLRLAGLMNLNLPKSATLWTVLSTPLPTTQPATLPATPTVSAPSATAPVALPPVVPPTTMPSTQPNAASPL